MLIAAVSSAVMAVALLAAPIAGPASAELCPEPMRKAGLCSTEAKIEDGGVDLSAVDNYAGAKGAQPDGSSRSDHTPEIIYASDPGRVCDTPDASCLSPGLPADPAGATAGFPAVTLADLVSFRPATPELTGEPAGFGVVRMPTNFVAEASIQEIPGVLLGYPVTVRFTPVAYVFSYGDGQSTRSATGGVAWTTSGSPQFTPTGTGHVYDARGTYVSSVTVEYSAAVNFGIGWQSVDGVVTARTGEYPVQVVEVRTALVEHTCAEDPHAAGC